MTDKNLNTIVEFLEGLKEQFEDAPEAKIRVSYTDLCEVLAATGKYDDIGYKYAEEITLTTFQKLELELLDGLLEKMGGKVTDHDRQEKYSLDQHNAKEEFLHEYKS